MSNLQHSESLSKPSATAVDAEAMDTGSSVGESVLDTKGSSSVRKTNEIVELQDSELCTLIDSLISGTTPL